ncbi:FAD-dependent monooxygenase [Streptomyces sp. 049-1]|uniref:FAD-dependent monooxygenase n=1 Tax=Streptomyces sp. 049-1 TaxID=2789264 RepID=UPI00398148DB
MTLDQVEAFDRLVKSELPSRPARLFGKACVLGGSIAGLLAARVLSDHAQEVVVVESDEVNVKGRPRAGVPQDRQGHGLLPGGGAQIERWLPGITKEAESLGAVLADPERQAIYVDGYRQARGSDAAILMGSRPFLESRIRERVLALPNVSTVAARATGFEYRDEAVCAVRYATSATGKESVMATDFVVDAMGRSSRLSEWVERDGYDRPRLERVRTGINYATAHFERSVNHRAEDLVSALARVSPSLSIDGVTVGAVNAIEDNQWLVMLMAYGENGAATSMENFRSACGKLPPIFAKATSGAVTRDILTYHQADSRRRRFAGCSHYPARLISVGDAVASYSPVYGQGITSAALHGSCLSQYLTSAPDLTTAARAFFALQEVVVDAAWAVSAGGDAAMMDEITGAEVPEDIQRQRWGMQQIAQATLTDETVSRAFTEVAYMLAHPSVLGDPSLIERAVAVNRGT